MNQYFKELFDGFREEEHWYISDMISRIGNKDLSFFSWSETMSKEERSFAYSLADKVDTEYYGGLINDDCWSNLAIFVEIMIYYIVYDDNCSWAMPNIGLCYAQAVNSVL